MEYTRKTAQKLDLHIFLPALFILWVAVVRVEGEDRRCVLWRRKNEQKRTPPKKKLARNTQKRELIMQAFLKAVREKQIFLESHASRLRTCTLFPSYLFFFLPRASWLKKKKKAKQWRLFLNAAQKPHFPFCFIFTLVLIRRKPKIKEQTHTHERFPLPLT